PTASLDPTAKWRFGYVASLDHEVAYTDENGNPLGTLTRGSKVKFNAGTDGRTEIFTEGSRGYLQEGAFIANNIADVIPAHTLYVRTAVNLRNENGRLLEIFAEKGESVEVTGYDYFEEDGSVHMYRVNYGGEDGYIMPWYLEKTEEASLLNYDGDGNYAIHADREDHYGGGFGANLDYFPREKGEIEGNIMPDECRTLYLVNWRLDEVDDYISIADRSGINAFVVDITDGSSIGYAGDVMKEYCPSGAAAAENTVEEYKAAIQKIKDAGYYVIGRITTFNDTYFIEDHPECAITDNNGDPLKLSGVYWPTPFDRTAWQYKVDLAVEAVELMGFNEIQFDYVRFPDLTSGYEEAGTIDFHNEYGETKAQAIQRFLMYATDILHEHGAYVSADVYGESAYTYVTAYGQYWPAISNVVDVISGMPYPDHFGSTETWRPWEHPYDTLYSWGESVMTRQSETATPAAVRTWIQAYNAIREPYNTYGPDEVAAQIRGLRDSGCTGGYMTWNASSSTDKYTSLIPAFAAP
ncbi:MAG: hypothetical protein IKY12_02480, partial [Clostridia bacterium]|nr:hypothetical protein [Clostridia bacterium]